LLVKDSANARKEHEKATRGGIKVDYVGFAFVALGLGCLQVVLDKGQEDDWFGSAFITTFVILSAVGIIGAILWELWGTKNPMVDLPLFRNHSFFFTNIMMFATMFILQSTTQILPQFVQQILPYDATHAGLTLMAGGFFLMAMMPLVGFLVRRVQPKYLIAFGFVVLGGALANLATLEPSISFGTVAMARVFQAAGFAFLFVPIQTLAYSNIEPAKANNASALINLMRNLGGSVGISVATTLLARRSQVHQNYLVGNLTATKIPFQASLHGLTQRFATGGSDSVSAGHQALAMTSQALQTQSAMLAYLDIFMVLMVASLTAIPLTFFLTNIKLGKVQAH
jgi:DHA2 family multidrug resistance protein